MSYEKLNLNNGDTLLAQHLQHIENGIESAHNRQPLTFTGAVSAQYDGSKEIVVKIPTGSTGSTSDSSFETILDFTTTETVVEFQIPIESETIVEKIKNAKTVYMALDIPRDAEDTETSTVGNVSVHLYATWKQTLFSGIPAIPPANVTWAKNGKVAMKYETILWDATNRQIKLPQLTWYAAYVDNYSSAKKTEVNFVNINAFSYLTTKNCYFIISGTQNLCTGTRFILGVC